MSCARGCCATQGEHYRSLTLGVYETGVQNQTIKRLDKYEDAVRQGMQPRTTGQRDIDAAEQISQATGSAFRAD